jgi:Rieske Fe-S protein
VYGRSSEYDPGWERERSPAYADGSWNDYDEYYAEEPAADDGGGWAYEDRGYEDSRRRPAAPRRSRAEARARAEADAAAAAAVEYTPLRIVSRGGRRRQLVLSALLGSAVALFGERVARLLTAGGSASAATTGTGTTGTTGAAPAAAAKSAAPPAGTGPVVLANKADIPVGSAKIFPAHKVVVTQPAAGTFKAYSTVCTHAGCLLDQVKANKIYCPCHPGVFNLDGTVASGPPPSALAAKHINVSGDQITL